MTSSTYAQSTGVMAIVESETVQGSMGQATAECGPDVPSWYGRGRWPECTCGFAPRDNLVLKEHWRAAGFTVVDAHGTLQVRPVSQTEVAAR